MHRDALVGAILAFSIEFFQHRYFWGGKIWYKTMSNTLERHPVESSSVDGGQR